MDAAPFFVVGADRSGTTLLKSILGRSSEVAIPPESHFVPRLLARRRRYGTSNRVSHVERFLSDLGGQPGFLRWGLPLDAVSAELDRRESNTLAHAMAAPFRAFARSQGKERWADKTPRYAAYILPLSRLWPESRFVHLVRDGRNVALSILDLERQWHRHAASAGYFWRRRVRQASSAGRQLGPARYLEVRYEDLVESPEQTARILCAFLDLPFQPELLQQDAAALNDVPPSQRARHANLAKPITRGLRDWRLQMPSDEVADFEALCRTELKAHGYELAHSRVSLSAHVRGRYRVGTFWLSTVGKRAIRHPLFSRRRRVRRVVASAVAPMIEETEGS